MVAVQVRGRPWLAVAADMIEGVVVSNGLQAPAGDRLRSELWEALGYELAPRTRAAAPAPIGRQPATADVGRVA